jgi:mRNA interferase RelE/StbE
VISYEVLLSANAEKQLDKLPKQIASPLINSIDRLAQDPRPNGCKKLKGRNAYRIRLGNYRIIYEIQDRILLVEVVQSVIEKIFISNISSLSLSFIPNRIWSPDLVDRITFGAQPTVMPFSIDHFEIET